MLLRGKEPFLGVPFHYRDSRTDGGMDRAFRILPREKIYAETGIQFMQLNTLHQFIDDRAARHQDPERLAREYEPHDSVILSIDGLQRQGSDAAQSTGLARHRARNLGPKAARGPHVAFGAGCSPPASRALRPRRSTTVPGRLCAALPGGSPPPAKDHAPGTIYQETQPSAFGNRGSLPGHLVDRAVPPRELLLRGSKAITVLLTWILCSDAPAL